MKDFLSIWAEYLDGIEMVNEEIRKKNEKNMKEVDMFNKKNKEVAVEGGRITYSVKQYETEPELKADLTDFLQWCVDNGKELGFGQLKPKKKWRFNFFKWFFKKG